ncbi:winged helix-turn-helix transcriptional regulator [Facklamia sp. DSM 111018]|uniref:Winged helix-turn-helix transcriptional regulator n=1 Tax=Facklamia lactis TaxID=2749967 RepID=A0ABS0LS59_9LACT|nr:metalloregulator ArsR/SmtB family transcription factor [Facklamia lactis]MBG9986918.1 winged helix-turn-helix transcriptional regulator [Facklamia lactis]
MNYEKLSDTLKSIADPNRLQIIELLSCGGLKACEILEFFNFSQPTLSYHMKVLCSEDLVHKSKEGRWIFYTLNEDKIAEIDSHLHQIFTKDKDHCLCDPIIKQRKKEKSND